MAVVEEIETTTHEASNWHVPDRYLSTLHRVSDSLASTLELAEILQISIEAIVDLLALDTGAIYTLEQGELYLGATTPPLPPGFPDAFRTAHLEDHPHINEASLARAPVYLEDARSAPLSPAEKVIVEARGLISILYYPLVLKDAVIGVFIVGTTTDVRRFGGSEIDLCYVLCGQVSLALANAQLHRRSQQSLVDLARAYDATLEGWSHLLDLRDCATDEHTKRVTALTVALAERMRVPESQMGDLTRGALLHDIGKMAISDRILQKPGPLSEHEWAVMKTHPQVAYDVLSRIEYLSPALDIPYAHHEKWDGTGYPRGLSGEDIPRAARLFSVVDVFDALTSDRPYRRAWKVEEAVRHIRESAGGHFDPAAVQAFLSLLGEP